MLHLPPHQHLDLALRGRVSGSSGSACHCPGAQPRSALHDWLGRSCALLAAVGGYRRCDIKHFCRLSWRRRGLSNHIIADRRRPFRKLSTASGVHPLYSRRYK
eukprot:361005-Chlamydomonas_euryale.AAC.2